MKKLSILKCLLFLSTIFLLQSCNEDDSTPFDENSAPWQSKTTLKATPAEDKETFIWLKDVLTLEEYWGNDVVELNMKLKSDRPTDDFSKVDIYIIAEEKDGYNYTAPFDDKGKLLKSMDMPESGEFTLELGANDVYALFSSDFQTDRSETLPVVDDFFLVYWVITANDGSVLDSREYVNYERYGIKVVLQDFVPPVWEGIFNYEIIDIGEPYSQAIGDTGSIAITDLGGGVYDVSNVNFDYFFSGPGKLYYDFLSGLTSVEGNSQTAWEISNVNGASLDIKWTYFFTADFNEWSQVTLTRTDGTDWPANINSGN